MALLEAKIEGGMLESGFWLYVVSVKHEGPESLYVGMTGDSSSANARSPIRRLGIHLGDNKANNSLTQYLIANKVETRSAALNLTAVKLFDETKDRRLHGQLYAKVNASERLLAEALRHSDYNVMNTVNCEARPDRKTWELARGELATRFPEISAFDGAIAASQRFTESDQSSGQLRFGAGEKFLFPSDKDTLMLRYGGTSIECKWDPRLGPDQKRSGVLRLGKSLSRRLQVERVYRVERDQSAFRLKIARKDWTQPVHG